MDAAPAAFARDAAATQILSEIERYKQLAGNLRGNLGLAGGGELSEALCLDMGLSLSTAQFVRRAVMQAR